MILAVGVVCAEDEATAQALAATSSAPFLKHTIVGDAASCRKQLALLAQAHGTTEILVTTMLPDFAARRRSYELLMQGS